MNDQPLPPNLKLLTDNLIESARKLLEQGRIAAVAFVGNADGGQITPIFLEQIGDKDQAAAHIGKVAAISGADFIFTILECWMLDERQARNYEAILKRYGSIADSPYGIEAVTFSLETQAGTWSAYCKQKPLRAGSSRKTFGEVKFQIFDGVAGRFANLLTPPAQATKQ